MPTVDLGYPNFFGKVKYKPSEYLRLEIEFVIFSFYFQKCILLCSDFTLWVFIIWLCVLSIRCYYSGFFVDTVDVGSCIPKLPINKKRKTHKKSKKEKVQLEGGKDCIKCLRFLPTWLLVKWGVQKKETLLHSAFYFACFHRIWSHAFKYDDDHVCCASQSVLHELVLSLLQLNWPKNDYILTAYVALFSRHPNARKPFFEGLRYCIQRGVYPQTFFSKNLSF